MSKLSEIDPASACLDRFRHSKEYPYRDISSLSSIPYSSLIHRNHGRLPKRKSASFQRYLTQEEEDVFVKCVLSMVQNEYRFRVPFIRKIAHHIKRQRNSTLSIHKYSLKSDDVKLPGRNWSAAFLKRHPELMRACKMPKKKERCDQHIYNCIDGWLQLIGPELDRTKVLTENIYNVIATAGVLKFPSTLTEIISDDAIRPYLKANDKEKVITAIECTSVDGEILDPLIIWPAQIHERNRKLHPILGWHHDQSRNGYIDSKITFKWITEVFEPHTMTRANGKQRLLISDTLADFNTLDLRTFCDTKNIVLCRPHSLAAQNLWACTASSFQQLQITLREALEQACNRCNNRETATFTLLYSHARDNAYNVHTTGAQFKGQNAVNMSADFSAKIQQTRNQGLNDSPGIAEDMMSLRKDIENDLACEVLSEAARGRIIRLLDVAEMGFANWVSSAKPTISVQSNKLPKHNLRRRSTGHGVSKIATAEKLRHR